VCERERERHNDWMRRRRRRSERERSCNDGKIVREESGTLESMNGH